MSNNRKNLKFQTIKKILFRVSVLVMCFMMAVTIVPYSGNIGIDNSADQGKAFSFGVETADAYSTIVVGDRSISSQWKIPEKNSEGYEYAVAYDNAYQDYLENLQKKTSGKNSGYAMTDEECYKAFKQDYKTYKENWIKENPEYTYVYGRMIESRYKIPEFGEEGYDNYRAYKYAKSEYETYFIQYNYSASICYEYFIKCYKNKLDVINQGVKTYRMCCYYTYIDDGDTPGIWSPKTHSHSEIEALNRDELDASLACMVARIFDSYYPPYVNSHWDDKKGRYIDEFRPYSELAREKNLTLPNGCYSIPPLSEGAIETARETPFVWPGEITRDVYLSYAIPKYGDEGYTNKEAYEQAEKYYETRLFAVEAKGGSVYLKDDETIKEYGEPQLNFVHSDELCLKLFESEYKRCVQEINTRRINEIEEQTAAYQIPEMGGNFDDPAAYEIAKKAYEEELAKNPDLYYDEELGIISVEGAKRLYEYFVKIYNDNKSYTVMGRTIPESDMVPEEGDAGYTNKNAYKYAYDLYCDALKLRNSDNTDYFYSTREAYTMFIEAYKEGLDKDRDNKQKALEEELGVKFSSDGSMIIGSRKVDEYYVIDYAGLVGQPGFERAFRAYAKALNEKAVKLSTWNGEYNEIESSVFKKTDEYAFTVPGAKWYFKYMLYVAQQEESAGETINVDLGGYEYDLKLQDYVPYAQYAQPAGFTYGEFRNEAYQRWLSAFRTCNRSIFDFYYTRDVRTYRNMAEAMAMEEAFRSTVKYYGMTMQGMFFNSYAENAETAIVQKEFSDRYEKELKLYVIPELGSEGFTDEAAYRIAEENYNSSMEADKDKWYYEAADVYVTGCFAKGGPKALYEQFIRDYNDNLTLEYNGRKIKAQYAIPKLGSDGYTDEDAYSKAEQTYSELMALDDGSGNYTYSDEYCYKQFKEKYKTVAEYNQTEKKREEEEKKAEEERKRIEEEKLKERNYNNLPNFGEFGFSDSTAYKYAAMVYEETDYTYTEDNETKEGKFTKAQRYDNFVASYNVIHSEIVEDNIPLTPSANYSDKSAYKYAYDEYEKDLGHKYSTPVYISDEDGTGRYVTAYTRGGYYTPSKKRISRFEKHYQEGLEDAYKIPAFGEKGYNEQIAYEIAENLYNTARSYGDQSLNELLSYFKEVYKAYSELIAKVNLPKFGSTEGEVSFTDEDCYQVAYSEFKQLILDSSGIYSGSSKTKELTSYSTDELYSAFVKAYVAAVKYKVLYEQSTEPNAVKKYDGEKNRQYAIVVKNGVATPDSDDISFLVVEYVDRDGYTRREYIKPEAAYKKAIDTAKGNTSYEIQNVVSGAMGLSYNPEDAELLQSYTTDVYFFNTIKEVKQFKSVSMQTSKGCDSFEWVVNDIQVVELNKLYGLGSVGYFSQTQYINYSGTADLKLASDNALEVKYNDSTFDTFEMKKINEAVNTYDKTVTYTVNISMADILGGGIEAYNTEYSSGALALAESLYAMIDYTDASGITHQVQYPVVANALAYYYDMACQETGKTGAALLSDKISFAQAGDSISFRFSIPELRKLNNVVITYSSNGQNGSFFKKLNSGDDNKAIRRAKSELQAGDEFYISGIQIYDTSSPVTYQANSGDAPINPAITSTPAYFYNAGTAKGLRIKDGESFAISTGASTDTGSNRKISATFNLIKEIELYSTGSSLTTEASKMEDKYVFEVFTDDTNNSATSSEVYISIKYYDKQGTLQTTEPYKISEYADEFYGYWAAASVSSKKGTSVSEGYSQGKAAYLHGTSKGNSFKFLCTLKNIDYISSISFSTSAKQNDDWQIRNFNVYRVRKLPARTVEGIETTNFNGAVTNRVYDRNFDYEAIKSGQNPDIDLVYSSDDDLGILVIPGGETNYEFYGEHGGTGTIEQEKERDFKEKMYSMSLEEASGDMGFTDIIKNYTVQVNVASNTEQGTADDSCGSDNYFYFQLVFEDGNSAYVLANQQLTSDGFRSGAAETFTVNCNMDYGELVAVNIVPDDIYEKTDPLDKLCIESINIIKSTISGIKKMWTVNNVGWIGPEYTDTGDDSSSSASQGRTAGEITYSYPVSFSSYVLSLEVAMSYGDAEEQYGQFEGCMTADLEYMTPTGQEKTMYGIQVVKSIYDYACQQPRIDANGNYYSNVDSMFRPHTTDRFYIDITDCQSINSITLHTSSPAEGSLNITNISFSIVTSQGYLKLNSTDEYQMKYDEEPQYLTSSVEPKRILTTGSQNSGAYQVTNTTFKVQDNEIPEIENEETELNIVTREPESQNDKVNIFIELDDGSENSSRKSTSPKKGNYNVTARLAYQAVDSTNTFNNVANLKVSDDGRSLYYKGMNAEKLATIKFLTLTVDKRDVEVYVKRCTVQQVRNGVVINTYTLNFGGNVALLASGVTSTQALSAETETKVQKAYIQLADDCDSQNLVEEKYDVAVAFKYTSSRDTSDKPSEVTTPYVFLTDAGINSIGPGKIMEFEFNEAYIGEITEIIIMPVGGLKVNTEKAMIVDMERVTDSTGNSVEKTSGYYSFDTGCKAATGGGVMKCTAANEMGEGAVQLVSIDFETVNAANGSDGGVKTADVTLSYNRGGQNKSLKTETFNDIRTRLTDKSATGFVTGQTQTVRLLVDNIDEIRSMQIVPKGENGSGSWTLKTITFNLYNYTPDGTMVATKVVDYNQTISEAGGGANINFSDINVKVDLTWTRADGVISSRTVDSNSISIIQDGGRSIKMVASVTGTLDDDSITATVEEVTASGATSAVAMDSYSQSGNTVTFTPPENATGSSRSYKITINSKETPAVGSSIVVEVPSTAVNSNNNGDTDVTEDKSEGEN